MYLFKEKNIENTTSQEVEFKDIDNAVMDLGNIEDDKPSQSLFQFKEIDNAVLDLGTIAEDKQP
jgi:Fe-S-cluster formation regulator IscX/YfhJ